MQTFMPYADIEKSLKCLDYKRLGKQRVEAMQTYNQVTKGNIIVHQNFTTKNVHVKIFERRNHLLLVFIFRRKR